MIAQNNIGKNLIQVSKPRIQEIFHPVISKARIRLLVLREDLVHPFISGNKWRKLKYNLEDYYSSGKKLILTFGGAYSNHLVAVAAAGKLLKIPTIGIVRGEEESSNDYLQFLRQCGMQLMFISREHYRKKEDPTELAALISQALKNFPGTCDLKEEILVLPEGGSTPAAFRGCREIVTELNEPFDVIACACGTGATLAGISASISMHQKVLGIAVLKGEDFLMKNIMEFNGSMHNTTISYDYHFGGYAKRPESLKIFCDTFSQQTGIPIEPVYTGKLFYGLFDLAEKGEFKTGSTILAVHTGGIFDFKNSLE